MTHFTQRDNGVCNTIIPLKRNRNWCFTLNNYTKSDIAQLHKEKHDLSLKKFCFQEEKGENGIPHLQGVIAYSNAKSFSSMKKLLPKAHWEKCRNLKAALAYCSKDETRFGETFTYNYTVVKLMTKEEWELWVKKDIQHEVDEVVQSMKGMTLSL